MVATLSVCAYITAIKEAADGGAFIGSHLLGAFVAGMCFVNVPRSQAIWNSQMKRVVKWMVRFFFAASVGFAVPVSEMFTLESFGNGLLLAIGPTITTKLFSGIFAYTRYTSPEAKARAAKASWITKYCHAQPQQLLVGAAMVARGEFAYMVADTAQSLSYEGGEPGQRMLAPGIYASVVWVLPQAQSAPTSTAARAVGPSLQRPTRLPGAARWAREERPPAAWTLKGGGGFAVRPNLPTPPPPLNLQAAARPTAHDDHMARPELAGRRPARRRPRPRPCCAGPKSGPTSAKPGPVDTPIDAPIDAPAQPPRGAATHAALPKRPPNPGPRQRGAVAQFVDVAVAKLGTDP